MLSVQTTVATQIAAIAPKVEEKVVSALVDRELARRSDALVTALDKLSKLEAEGYKLKADIIAYDENGQKTSETFSKARIEERKKQQQKVEKLTKAINKALENSDFSDVYNFAKGEIPTDKDTGGSEPAGE